MRKLIAVVASTAALLFAGMANAAPTEIIFTQTGPGANTWGLSINVTDPVTLSAIVFGIQSTPVGDFVITAANTSVDAFAPTGFSAKNVAGDVLNLLLQSGSQGSINGASGQGIFVIGTLTAPAGFTFIPDENTGGTVQDTDFNSLPFTLVINPAVPEPAMAVLLGLGLAGLGLVRRRAA